MKYHIKAWGHPSLPDLDYETDEYPDIGLKAYPMLDVRLLTPMGRELINAAFAAQDKAE